MPPKSSYSSVHPPSTKSHHPSTAPNDAHDILAALDVVEALDTMPMELTKTFGDLRELDAVLNATITHLTSRLSDLTSLLEPPSSSFLSSSSSAPAGPEPHQRFQLLLEIAEELTRYKLGSDDKIKVAGQACDLLVSHQTHISSVLNSSTLLVPHLHPSSSTATSGAAAGVTNTLPASTSKNRNRGSPNPSARAGSVVDGNTVHTTPSKKRKKTNASSVLALGDNEGWDEDNVVAGVRSKGSPALGGAGVSGTGAGAGAATSTAAGGKKSTATGEKKKISGAASRKKAARNASPADSMSTHSVSNLVGGPEIDQRLKNPSETAAVDNKNSRPSPALLQNAMFAPPQSLDHEAPVSLKSSSKSSGSKNGSGNAAGAANLPLSTGLSSSSVSKKNQSNSTQKEAKAGGAVKRVTSSSNSSEKGGVKKNGGGAHAQGQNQSQGQGHGPAQYPALPLPEDPPMEVDDVGADTELYCYCQKPGYGAMIGCDSDDCEIQWFHLACLGMESPPEGDWYCPPCTEVRKMRETKGKNKKSAKAGSKRR